MPVGRTGRTTRKSIHIFQLTRRTISLDENVRKQPKLRKEKLVVSLKTKDGNNSRKHRNLPSEKRKRENDEQGKGKKWKEKLDWKSERQRKLKLTKSGRHFFRLQTAPLF